MANEINAVAGQLFGVPVGQVYTAGPGIVIDNVHKTVTNVGAAISKTEGTRCGTFNGSPMYIKLFEKAITVNASETTYNFTIDIKVGTDNVTNMWIDPSNSYILYGSAGSNVVPLTYRIGNGREGSIFISGKNSGSMSFRGIDTSQTPMTAFIAVKYTVSS